MKEFTYQFNSSDLETLYFVLSSTTDLLPVLVLDDFDECAKINQAKYARSAAHKLEKLDTKISSNELQASFNALVLSARILYKEIPVSEEIFDFFSKYAFSIEKLLPIFSDYLSDQLHI